jgi:hypothetical protein
VYRVALDVAAAALARALLTVAISYYFLLVILGMPDSLNCHQP